MKYKKLNPNAHAPTKAHKTDAGYDLKALNDVVVEPIWFSLGAKILKRLFTLEAGEPLFATKIETGIAVQIPEGQVGLIWDKSGIGYKLLKVFGGVIDCGYTGDVSVNLVNFGLFSHRFASGDKLAQLVIQNIVVGEPEEISLLEESERGDKGYGSSGV